MKKPTPGKVFKDPIYCRIDGRFINTAMEIQSCEYIGFHIKGEYCKRYGDIRLSYDHENILKGSPLKCKKCKSEYLGNK